MKTCAENKTETGATPLGKIISSLPVFGLISSTFAFGMSYFSLLNQMPMFFTSVLKLDNFQVYLNLLFAKGKTFLLKMCKKNYRYRESLMNGFYFI